MPEEAIVPPTALTDSVEIGITSETDPLRQVVVHTPGLEMELVSPENRFDLLFEDILFVGDARKEHLSMCRVFQKIVGRPDAVLQVADLLGDVFALEDARDEFIARLSQAHPERNLQPFEDDLRRLSPEELHTFALTGQSPLPIHLHPLPNLIFTRDIAAVVHDHIILSHAATTARARESVIIEIILRYHPSFAAFRDRLVVLPRGVTFEGGDLLVAAPNVVILGHSQRTSFGGLITVAQELFRRTPVEHVLMVDLPKRRWCMHLDTVFTFASPSECVVFPPLLDQDHFGNVVHFTKGDAPDRFVSEVCPDLRQALRGVLDRPITFIPCGGPDPLGQRREQWTDGANFFALAPGVVIGYERNVTTFETMRAHGYRVVSANGFLHYHEASAFVQGEKVAIKLEGNELSRGRGGPRCMTLPLCRSALPASA